jgi:hypothetical protein
MADSNQLHQSGQPTRRSAILLKAKKGAVRAGIGVFVVILIFCVVIRTLQFRMIGWDAYSMLLRFDLLIALYYAAGGALIGATTGAILALQGSGHRKALSESEQHPLD